MKYYSFFVASGFAALVGCASQPAPQTPVTYNAADWTPPEEVVMNLPEAPKASKPAPASTGSEHLRPTSYSQGKGGALVNLPTKR
jgi:hypothetical protein